MKRLPSRVSVALLFLSAFCICAPLILQAWQTRPPRNGLGNQALLNGPNSMSAVYKEISKRGNASDELELRMDVQRIYALSSELKDEVDRANSEGLLNVSVLKRTQDIEKLARQIRERIKH